ncbi:MAG TPA: XRE family transcriptional regulator [Peptococcaceae bacterium]|nr:MAG: Putative transcriptional regulator, Nlp [Clostridia bacterium 41_269]HBT19870.1 XRE family transcriptional regulator [Peptococcaceae bacterium]
MLRLTVERKKRRISQMQLAALTGIHPSNLSRIERGVVPAYRGWRLRIAKALGWPLERADELFEEVEERRVR